MNAAKQELLNAARTCAEAARADDEVAHWLRLRQQGDGALAGLVVAALNAFPADAPPAPEIVRSVDDLRDGDTATITAVRRGRFWRLDDVQGAGLFTAGSEVEAHLVAAGAVTRPPAPEPDPAEVERLAGLLSENDLTLRDPS